MFFAPAMVHFLRTHFVAFLLGKMVRFILRNESLFTKFSPLFMFFIFSGEHLNLHV